VRKDVIWLSIVTIVLIVSLLIMTIITVSLVGSIITSNPSLV